MASEHFGMHTSARLGSAHRSPRQWGVVNLGWCRRGGGFNKRSTGTRMAPGLALAIRQL